MNSYLIIKVEGKIIEKFILRCKKNNINLLKIERISNKEIIIKINSKDYENLNKIKSIYTLTIINNEGYLKFKEELNKNKVFIIMAILGLLFLIYLSNTIFSVNIISMNKDLNEKIIKELDSYGIKKYHLKKSYDSIEKIKKKIEVNENGLRKCSKKNPPKSRGKGKCNQPGTLYDETAFYIKR